jgi:hypothetical protein
MSLVRCTLDSLSYFFTLIGTFLYVAERKGKLPRRKGILHSIVLETYPTTAADRDAVPRLATHQEAGEEEAQEISAGEMLSSYGKL